MKNDDIILLKTNILLLRSLLIKHSESQIISYLDDENLYFSFLKNVENMLELDSDFLLLNDYFSKMQYVIRLGSEKFKTRKNIRQKENELIVTLNDISSTNDKEEIIDSYLAEETVMREYLPYKDELLFNSMASDYYIIKEIQSILNVKDNICSDDFKNYSPRAYLSSMSFFMYTMPELYIHNPDCIKITKDYLKSLKKENPELKIYTKNVQKRLAKF